LQAEETISALFKNKTTNAAPFQTLMSASGEILLDSAQAAKDAEAMYGDAEFAGWKGNVQFFTDTKYPRGFDKLTAETQTAFIPLALLKGRTELAQAQWDFNTLTTGLNNTAGLTAPKFDTTQVANVVNLRQQQGNLSEGALYSFEVYFQPNQNAFSADLYNDAFNKVIDLASTSGGAIITIEGHSDPLGYLKQKKAGEQDLVLSQVRQAAKNLSMTRANAVRDSLIEYAKKKGVTLDQSQFAVVGHGIAHPKSGICGTDPCPPKTQQEWLNNMRVEFRIIQVEAEESVFKPL
jgi:outer membrane protein OmpA-like peptidoglycan-associated protein